MSRKKKKKKKRETESFNLCVNVLARVDDKKHSK